MKQAYSISFDEHQNRPALFLFPIKWTDINKLMCWMMNSINSLV